MLAIGFSVSDKSRFLVYRTGVQLYDWDWVLQVSKRPQPGDVFELQSLHGLGYIQNLGLDPLIGYAIAVCAREHAARPVLAPSLFVDAYVTFYPLRAAVDQQLVTLVGWLTPRELPRRFRRPLAMRGRRVLTWRIADLHSEEAVVRERLSSEEQRLPLESGWGHEALRQAIARGWRPETDPATLDRWPDDETPGPPGTPTFEFYLYMPTPMAATAAGRELRAQGYGIDVRPSANDDGQWLLLATRVGELTPEEFAAAEALMERLAAAAGGEYDGWQAEEGGGESAR